MKFTSCKSLWFIDKKILLYTLLKEHQNNPEFNPPKKYRETKSRKIKRSKNNKSKEQIMIDEIDIISKIKINKK
jgi:hypothetical protein